MKNVDKKGQRKLARFYWRVSFTIKTFDVFHMQKTSLNEGPKINEKCTKKCYIRITEGVSHEFKPHARESNAATFEHVSGGFFVKLLFGLLSN